MDETQLIEMLNTLADGGRVTADVRDAVKKHGLVVLDWRDETDRRFAELVSIAERIGDVKEWQRMRGIEIEGETQYVLDPALLSRFGFPDDDDAAETAAMLGFPQYPYALDIDGNKIPLLSARFPRPQRRHRQFPMLPDKYRPDFGPSAKIGPAAYAKPKPSPGIAASEQSRGAGTGREATRGEGAPLPPYARGFRTPAPAPTNALADYVAANPTATIDKTMSPLRQELMARAAALKQHGPANPKPRDNAGRPSFAAIRTGQRADDPPEKTG